MLACCSNWPSNNKSLHLTPSLSSGNCIETRFLFSAYFIIHLFHSCSSTPPPPRFLPHRQLLVTFYFTLQLLSDPGPQVGVLGSSLPSIPSIGLVVEEEIFFPLTVFFFSPYFCAYQQQQQQQQYQQQQNSISKQKFNSVSICKPGRDFETLWH